MEVKNQKWKKSTLWVLLERSSIVEFNYLTIFVIRGHKRSLEVNKGQIKKSTLWVLLERGLKKSLKKGLKRASLRLSFQGPHYYGIHYKLWWLIILYNSIPWPWPWPWPWTLQSSFLKYWASILLCLLKYADLSLILAGKRNRKRKWWCLCPVWNSI